MKKLYYTVKQWKKFDYFVQRVLLKKYDVILTDHQTRNERIVSALKRINPQNLNSSIEKFNSAVNSFSKSMDSLSAEMGSLGGRADAEKLWGKRKNTHAF